MIDMIKQKKYVLFVLGWILLCLISSIIYRANAADADITLQVVGLGIRHWTPDNLAIWTVMMSPNDQEIDQQFTTGFRVEDLEWLITGHYTTIQCEGVYGPNMTILTWIELKAGSATPSLLMGTTGNNVYINPDLSQYINITDPITYFYKETNPNNKGLLNKYGDKPWIKILIPSSAPAGVYSGTIVFSFYPY